MKALAALFTITSALLLVACTQIPAPAKQEIRDHYALYRSVSRGNSRQELEVRLGAPLRQDADGSYYWETRFDRDDFAALKVWFDANNCVAEAQIIRGRGLQVPGLKTESTVVRDR